MIHWSWHCSYYVHLNVAFVYSMKSLVDLGIYNVILTSGTLSPLMATISEIGIPVKVQLSNEHIIKKNQVSSWLQEELKQKQT